MAWWRVNSEALNAANLQRLPADVFRAKFLAALAGQTNEFSPYLKRGSNRPAASIWAKLRAAVFQRDNFTCKYCSSRGGELECDHVHPVSRGGQSDLNNLVTSCRGCNRSKRAMTLEEWGGRAHG